MQFVFDSAVYPDQKVKKAEKVFLVFLELIAYLTEGLILELQSRITTPIKLVRGFRDFLI